MNVDGETKEWDIQKITFPFEDDKKNILKYRFGISNDELSDFYLTFAKAVKRCVKVSRALASSGEPSVETSTLFIQKFKVEKTDTGKTQIYMLYEPSEPLIGSSLITDEGSYLSNIISLGLRLLQTVKNFDKVGAHLGTIDLDSVSIVQKDGKTLVKTGYLRSAVTAEYPLEYPGKDIATFLPENVASGEVQPSLSSDIYAICALMWTMLDGKHYTEKPDFTHPPKYADEDIASALRLGMDEGQAALKTLNTVLRNKRKALVGGENVFVQFSEATYLAEMRKYEEAQEEIINEHKARMEEEESQNPANDSEQTDTEDQAETPEHRKISRKRLTMTIGCTALLLLVFAAIFLAGKVMGELGWPQKAEISSTPAPIEESPASPPASNPTNEDDASGSGPLLVLNDEYAWYKTTIQEERIAGILLAHGWVHISISDFLFGHEWRVNWGWNRFRDHPKLCVNLRYGVE